MPDLLSSLTADRLDELAASSEFMANTCEKSASGAREHGDPIAAGYHGKSASEYRQLAAICKTLAGAERAMLASGGTLSVEAEAIGGFAATMEGATGAGFTSDNSPTLIAALASVAKQEETT